MKISKAFQDHVQTWMEGRHLKAPALAKMARVNTTTMYRFFEYGEGRQVDDDFAERLAIITSYRAPEAKTIFETAFRKAPCPMVLHDGEHVLYANDAATMWLNAASHEEIEGRVLPQMPESVNATEIGDGQELAIWCKHGLHKEATRIEIHDNETVNLNLTGADADVKVSTS